MRRYKYIRRSAFALVLVMMTLLVTRSLHVYSHSIQILNEVTHSSCTCSSDDNHQDDDSKNREHKCLICDYVVSPFLENELPEYDFALSIVHYTFQFPLIEDERSEIIVHKASRAPPAQLFS